MGRKRSRRKLSVEEELVVSEYMETKVTYTKEKKEEKLPKIKNFVSKTDKQGELVTSIEENEITIAIGSSGCGKSYGTCATALSLIEQGLFETITLVKSVTTLPGEDIGHLPGQLQEKMEPFMMSFNWTFEKLIGKDAMKKMYDQGIIRVLPLAFVRGISIDNSIVIIDESQNLSFDAFKAIITRIGTNSKYVFLGDVEQIDRKKKEESCLASILKTFEYEDYIGTIEFSDEDCVRNPIIPKILEKLREINV